MEFTSNRDPVVDVDAMLSPREIATRLAPDENVMVSFVQNPRCPDRERIARMWVLSNGSPGETRQSREDAERMRRAQAGIDMVMQAHGVSIAPAAQAP